MNCWFSAAISSEDSTGEGSSCNLTYMAAGRMQFLSGHLAACWSEDTQFLARWPSLSAQDYKKSQRGHSNTEVSLLQPNFRSDVLSVYLVLLLRSKSLHLIHIQEKRII